MEIIAVLAAVAIFAFFFDAEIISAICIVGIIAIYTLGIEEKKTEYTLDLINQDKVEIHSNLTGKTYLTTHDSIQYYLELDNM